MVEAEEESREEESRMAAAAATRPNVETTRATKNREAPTASHANGIDSTQFCKNVYSKPGALFSVYRLPGIRAVRAECPT
jgi:hypothetical protein